MNRISIETGLSTNGSRFHTHEGRPIHGVVEAVITMKPDAPVTATLKLFACFNGNANADFVVADPASGLLKTVQRIEFADGTVFDSESAG